MRRSAIFFYFCCCFLAGVALRSILNFDCFYLFILLVVSCVASVLMKKKVSRVLLLGAVFLFFGVWRYQISLPKVDENQIAFYNGQIVTMAGKIAAEPDVREKNQKIILGDIKLSRDRARPVLGQILINANKFEKYNYGDEVELKCKLQAPDVIEAEDEFSRDFDYGRYLAVRGIYSVCYNPEKLIIASHQISDTRYQGKKINGKIITEIYKNILSAKQKFKNIIDQHLPLPQSGLLAAILFGYRGELPEELNQQFSITGLTHIIAISGLNITLIAGLLWYALAALGLTRQRAFWWGALVLLLYVLMIGLLASAVRALVMGLILMYGLKIGRPAKSINALLAAAVVLLFFNPKLLLFDIGFQLSFLAVLGMMWFYEWLEKGIKTLKHKSIKTRLLDGRLFELIVSMLALTLAAQILTLPLIIYYFGRLSLIAPIANIFVLPVLPALTVAGLALVLAGLIWSKLAFVLGILVWLIISYIIKVVEIFSRLPGAAFRLKVMPWWPIMVVYIVILLLAILLLRRKKLEIKKLEKK